MGEPPPAPPPLPPSPPAPKPSSITLKLREALQNFDTQHLKFAGKDSRSTPAGTYFLYGTLRDPRLLSEILQLNRAPLLRPAYITGYHKMRWGQYPALVDGATNQVVEGAAFDVPDAIAAARLADYETRNYTAEACVLHVRNDDGSEQEVEGYTFKFCGDLRDLTEGDFDLETWMKQVKRA